MSEVLKIIQERQSARVSCDPNRQLTKENLEKILEGHSGRQRLITCKTST